MSAGAPAPFDVASLGIRDLVILHEAVAYQAEASLAFQNQPRAAGGIVALLEERWECLLSEMDTIEDELGRRQSTGGDEIERLAFLARIAVRRENYTEAADLAARADVLKAAEWARFCARHRVTRDRTRPSSSRIPLRSCLLLSTSHSTRQLAHPSSPLTPSPARASAMTAE